SLPWLDFIAREHAGQLQLLEILKDGAPCGFWPLLTVSKLGFKLMGSPLRGWLTSHMGPILDGPVEGDLIRSLLRFGRRSRIAYLEFSGKSVDDSVLAEFGFSTGLRETWVLDIEGSEEEQWSKLHHNCRKNIRKAERSPLEVRELEGPQYYPRLYELVVRTFRKKALPVPFAYRRLDLLQDTIGKSRQMLFLGV